MSKTSVELFIYPQFYDATWSPTALNPTEYVPDGILWLTAFNLIVPTISANPLQEAVSTLYPPISNEWYGFYSDGNLGQPVANQPTQTALGLNSFTTYSQVDVGAYSGAYTEMTGLSIGTNYEINIVQATFSLSITRELTLMVFDSAGVLVQTINVPNADINGQVTLPPYTFLATDTAHVIGWQFRDTALSTTNFKMQLFSVTELTNSSYSVEDLLSDGQVMLDLYNFEDIPLTLSVDNFINAAEKVQSYSKAFKIPGTKRNNRILKNEYEITSSIGDTTLEAYDFNPLRKTQIYLQQEGYIIFEGFMKLISVDVKDGELMYNINLYSEVIALKDKLKNKKFNDLDFTELTHNYLKSSIKSSWNSSGLLLNQPLGLNSFAGATGSMNTTVLKYPFIDWDHSMVIADGSGDPSANVGYPEGVNLGSAFRPVIQLRYLINNIFRDAGFTYSSTYFDSSDFGKLFMDFNWGDSNTPDLNQLSSVTSHYYNNTSSGSPPTNSFPYGAGYKPLIQYQVNNANTVSEAPPDYDFATGIYTSTTNNQQVTVNFQFKVYNVFGAFDTGLGRFKWVKNLGMANATNYNTYTAFIQTNTAVYSGSLTVWLDIGDTLQPMCASDWPFTNVTLRQGSFQFVAVDTPTCKIEWNVSEPPLVADSLLSTLRGKLGQWDFLSGLLQMFNLITMVNPDNPNNIIISTYDEIFNNITGSGLDLESRGINKDWTNKVDAQEWKFKPLSNLKRNTIFQYFEDKKDYVFKNYKDAFQGFLYGSYEIDASDYNILQGTQKIEAKPFAATLIKAYDPAFPWMITPAIYSVADNGESSAFDNAPRILYDNGSLTIGPANTYFFPSQNGEFGENFQKLYQMSNFSQLPPTSASNDLNYGTCQVLNVNNNTINTLYNRFWANYYSQLYNPDTRSLTLKINLTPSDINQFSFSDLVMIKNRAYRVNKIDYKAGELAKVELILIT